MECRLRDGRTERWCSHDVIVGGERYEPRVLKHNQFDLRLASEDGIDASGRFAVTLANVDSKYSQIERTSGWKGARLRVSFLFYDLRNGVPASDPIAVFLGTGNPPEEVTEKYIRLSFANRLSLQRVMLPTVRVQPRCPWMFPKTNEQRQEALDGGKEGVYSKFYNCGYSADIDGGSGNLDAQGAAYANCNYSKSDCLARGMYDTDASGRPTGRFGGFQFLPASVLVRTHGSKESRQSEIQDNRARANDVVPMVYGTAWIQPPVVFSRNDGNLTHCEVLLGLGPMEGVHRVVVSGAEIPLGVAGRDMTATGWYNVVSLGTRNGGFNLNFRDQGGNPLGDPHGGIAVMAIAVPNRLNDGTSIPKIEVLLDGLKLERFGETGESLGPAFTRNPAWIILDLMRRSGWEMEEIDLQSFSETAQSCDEDIQGKDANANPILTKRFECNLAVTQRRSAADLVRGVRLGTALMLTFNGEGKLQLRREARMSEQQPDKLEGSNSRESWNGGWPAYEFGDGSNGFSGVLRRETGEPTLRWWSRSTGECVNRLTVEFQNAFNEYQHDCISLVDLDDLTITGQELSATLPALGLPNLDQAARVTRFHLMKGLQGNEFVEFESSVVALGLRPGDLITLTCQKEGLDRAPFRIIRLAPSTNYETVKITAQRHIEGWYDLLVGSEGMDSTMTRQNRRQGGIPRPIAGLRWLPDGEQAFEVAEGSVEQTDGTAAVQLKVRFTAPSQPKAAGLGSPILGLSPIIDTIGGTLPGGDNWYYAVSAINEAGEESDLSFVVRATLPPVTNTNRVTLTGISLSAGSRGIRVYRGPSPTELMLIQQVDSPVNQFSDNGLIPHFALPPDPAYDHANFYWRQELLPETQAVHYGPRMIGNPSAAMLEHEYRGAIIRIVRGRGRGQERVVMDNDETSLSLATPWTTLPDATSWYVIAESNWRFGGSTRSEEITFEILNRRGTFVQVSGRSANSLDQESPSELSVLHRHLIGGSSGAEVDADVPPKPFFALGAGRRGRLDLVGIGFPTLENTGGVSSGTLTLYYWDELQGPTPHQLAGQLDATSMSLFVSAPAYLSDGQLLQIDQELLRVRGDNTGNVVEVERGVLDSYQEAHAASKPVWFLQKHVVITPFPRQFFGSPASGSYSLSIPFPNVRVAAAQFHVTNTKGDSPVSSICFAMLSDGGLRSFSGGQYTIQIPGEPALENSVAPPLVIEETQALGDVFATVGEAPVGGALMIRLRVDGQHYCDLSIGAGDRTSDVVSGVDLPPLKAGSELTVDVISVPLGLGSRPGRNLTVTIRL